MNIVKNQIDDLNLQLTIEVAHADYAENEKKELNKKLEDFKNERDTMEEVYENCEQIEISKYYERQPKPSLVAIYEFQHGEIEYRMAHKEEE